MGLFQSKKESGYDVLDIPEMSRRGLIKLDKIEKAVDFLDLRTNNGLPMPAPQTVAPLIPTAVPVIPNNMENDFINSLAGVGQTIQSSSTSAPVSHGIDAETLHSVKNVVWRVDNAEYKLEQILARIASLEEQLRDKSS